jgi:hypothetical protein
VCSSHCTVTTDVTAHSIMFFKYLASLESDIKVAHFNELYVPYHVPLFCSMRPFVENE